MSKEVEREVARTSYSLPVEKVETGIIKSCVASLKMKVHHEECASSCISELFRCPDPCLNSSGNQNITNAKKISDIGLCIDIH